MAKVQWEEIYGQRPRPWEGRGGRSCHPCPSIPLRGRPHPLTPAPWEDNSGSSLGCRIRFFLAHMWHTFVWKSKVNVRCPPGLLLTTLEIILKSGAGQRSCTDCLWCPESCPLPFQYPDYRHVLQSGFNMKNKHLWTEPYLQLPYYFLKEVSKISFRTAGITCEHLR